MISIISQPLEFISIEAVCQDTKTKSGSSFSEQKVNREIALRTR